MRFSLLTVGAFAAGSIAAPTFSAEKRQVGNVLQVVEGLYKQVTQLTGSINATVDVAANLDVEAVDLANVTASIKVDISAIVKTIGTVLNQTSDLTDLTNVGGVLSIVTGLTSGLPVVGSVTKRQANVDVSAIADIVVNLVTEVTATVDQAKSVVPGLELDEILEPLTITLNNLLDDLENVIEGVLHVVNSVLKVVPIVNVLNLEKLDF